MTFKLINCTIIFIDKLRMCQNLLASINELGENGNFAAKSSIIHLSENNISTPLSAKI